MIQVEQMYFHDRNFLFQVFFRAGALSQLEAARDEKITGTIVAFQARCRGTLGRKKLKELRVGYNIAVF